MEGAAFELGEVLEENGYKTGNILRCLLCRSLTGFENPSFHSKVPGLTTVCPCSACEVNKKYVDIVILRLGVDSCRILVYDPTWAEFHEPSQRRRAARSCITCS
jgi:hypothetical protein